LLAFVAYEKRCSYPLVNLSLFESKVFTANNFALLLGFAPLGAAHFLMPFYLQGPKGFTPQETGIIMLPFPFGNTLGSLVIGRLTERFSSSILSIISLAFIIGGYGALSLVETGTSLADLLWRVFVAGFGIGAFQTAITNLIISAVPAEQRGSTSGVLSMFQATGVNVGTAVSGVVLATVTNSQFAGLEGSLATPAHFAQLAGDPTRLADLESAFGDGFAAAFAAVTAFAMAGMLFALYSLRVTRKQERSVRTSDARPNIRPVPDPADQPHST
jgi:MFS family permease